MTFRLPPPSSFHYDIDDVLNPYIPKSQVHRLPRPIARFLGHQSPGPQNQEQQPQQHREVGNLLICIWSFVGSFLGLLLVAGVFKSPGIQTYHPPVLLASFGASAILEYNVIKSPLGQPRNSILGHTFSALVGVAITKLFLLSHSTTATSDLYLSHRWLLGALACATASVVMTLTNTLHPPGGATAVLAAVDPAVVAMGWSVVPLVVLASVLMLLVACLVLNVQRRFPVFWWTAAETGSFWEERGKSRRGVLDQDLGSVEVAGRGMRGESGEERRHPDGCGGSGSGSEESEEKQGTRHVEVIDGLRERMSDEDTYAESSATSDYAPSGQAQAAITVESAHEEAHERAAAVV